MEGEKLNEYSLTDVTMAHILPSKPQKDPRWSQTSWRSAEGMKRRYILTQSVVMFGDDTKHTHTTNTEDFDDFQMPHRHHCCEASSIIISTVWDSVTMVSFHVQIQVCTRLYWSPLQEDKQWWTSSYTELHSAWYMNLGSREEKLKAKGRSPEQSNRGDKESSKKEFSKSKQTNNRNDDKKMGEMSMTWEHQVFMLIKKKKCWWKDVKTQCKHLLIICFYCVYFGVEGVVNLPHV